MADKEDQGSFKDLWSSAWLFVPVFGIIVIDLSSEKQNADAGIQPQHDENNGSQAAVHHGIIAEIAKVNRKGKGEGDPPQCGKDGSWQLSGKMLLFFGYIGI